LQKGPDPPEAKVDGGFRATWLLDFKLQYNYNVCVIPITFSWEDKKNEQNVYYGGKP